MARMELPTGQPEMRPSSCTGSRSAQAATRFPALVVAAARQYEHIKDSAKDQGASESRAEEIAARTVNKERARSGESRQRSRTSTDDMSSSRRGGQRSGTGRPKGRTRDQLYEEARQLNIDGRSSMNKDQLERAVDRKK